MRKNEINRWIAVVLLIVSLVCLYGNWVTLPGVFESDLAVEKYRKSLKSAEKEVEDDRERYLDSDYEESDEEVKKYYEDSYNILEKGIKLCKNIIDDEGMSAVNLIKGMMWIKDVADCNKGIMTRRALKVYNQLYNMRIILIIMLVILTILTLLNIFTHIINTRNKGIVTGIVYISNVTVMYIIIKWINGKIGTYGFFEISGLKKGFALSGSLIVSCLCAVAACIIWCVYCYFDENEKPGLMDIINRRITIRESFSGTYGMGSTRRTVNVCKFCGNGIAEGETFCTNCGKSIYESRYVEPTREKTTYKKSGGGLKGSLASGTSGSVHREKSSSDNTYDNNFFKRPPEL